MPGFQDDLSLHLIQMECRTQPAAEVSEEVCSIPEMRSAVRQPLLE
jgi:hypothetical protein